MPCWPVCGTVRAASEVHTGPTASHPGCCGRRLAGIRTSGSPCSTGDPPSDGTPIEWHAHGLRLPVPAWGTSSEGSNPGPAILRWRCSDPGRMSRSSAVDGAMAPRPCRRCAGPAGPRSPWQAALRHLGGWRYGMGSPYDVEQTSFALVALVEHPPRLRHPACPGPDDRHMAAAQHTRPEYRGPR